MITYGPYRYCRLSADDEIALARARDAGDPHAIDELMAGNAGLVRSVAKYFPEKGIVGFWDLVQEGEMGLREAALKFDPERGCRFSTYAVPWIMQPIRRELARRGRTIKIPEYLLRHLNRLQMAIQKFVYDFGYEPSPEELAEILELPLQMVEKLIEVQSLAEPVSYETVLIVSDISDREGRPPEYYVQDPNRLPEEVLIVSEQRQILDDLIIQADLSENEVKVINCRFLADNKLTLDDTGKLLKVTRERIRQIEKAALKKMRRYCDWHPEMAELLQV